MSVKKALAAGLAFAAFGLAAFSCAQNANNVGPTCGANEEQCGAICTSVKTDSENCGKCDSKCPSGQVCVSGACATSCPNGDTVCGPDGGGGASCVNTKSDNSSCGKCGRVCPSGQVCFQGGCGSTCGGNTSGQTLCGADGGSPYCAPLQTDNQNCGKCGVKCGANEVCSNGACQSSCDMSQTLCGTDGGTPYCANVQTDNGNCGNCGIKCTGLQSCTMGVCIDGCAWNQLKCTQADGGPPYCVDYLTDNKNCGACNVVCPMNLPVCAGGKCSSGGQPPTCVTANGLQWCYNNAACGQACTAVCQALGMTTVNTATWLAAQDTVAECITISQAFGLGNSVSVNSYTYACAEDNFGNHTVNGGIVGPILCSSYNLCPQSHLTNMDQLGVACGGSSRRSICPCQ